jgi:hypothetical protein
MAALVYTNPSSAQVAANALITTALMRDSIKRNFDLIDGVWDDFTHFFTTATNSYKGLEDFTSAAANNVAHGRLWSFVSDTGVAPSTRVAVKTAPSVCRLALSATAAEQISVFSRRTIQPDQVVLPLIYETRVKFSQNDRGYWFGPRDPSTANINESPATVRKGVQILRSSATQGVFRCVGTGTQTGTAFTIPTAGTWFTITIIINSATSALCYVDEVLKETFSSDVPGFAATTAVPLAAHFACGITTATALNLDVDYVAMIAGLASRAA